MAPANCAPGRALPTRGGTDAVARALGQKLSTRLGKPVVIDNKPGASTIIGTDSVVKAEPDGYTLLVSGSTSYTVNAALRPKLPYDPLKDLAPVAIVARAPLVIVVSASSPHKDFAALLAAAKAAPKTINYATFGSGSAPTWSAHCWSRPLACVCRTCPTGAAHRP